MRTKPDAAEDASRARGPAKISRRMTRHQSRSPTSPSASARMTSVDACDPELPPLEMMSGTNSARTTRLRDLVLEGAHRRGRQHLAEEQRGEPAGALPDHAREPDVHVGLVERLRSADALDVLRRLCLGHVEHVVDGDDADQHAGRVGDGQRGAVVGPEGGHRGRLVVCRLQRDEPAVHQVGQRLVERRRAAARGCGCRR